MTLNVAHSQDRRLQKPERFNFATDVVDSWAAKYPRKEAMYWVSQDFSDRRSLSYQDFSRESHRIATLLGQLGTRQGDVMVIVLPRVPEWWSIALAGIRAGIIISPGPTLLSRGDIQYRCNKSNATIFVGDDASIQKFEAVRSKCPQVKTVIKVGGIPEANTVLLHEALKNIPKSAVFQSDSLPWHSPALIYFTSGTSGPPKMVQHNQISYPYALTNTAKHFHQLGPGKLFWNMADQGWAKAAWSFFGAWNRGASLFVFDDRKAFSAQRLLDVLHTFPITTLCAAPLAWRQLALREAKEYFVKYPPLALAHCTAAGEALNDEVIKEWRKLSGLDIHDGYGQTETILLCGNFVGCPIRPGSMGKPAPTVPLFVIDAKGEECGVGEEGNIAVKLDSGEAEDDFFGIFDGYIKDDGSLDRRELTVSRNGVTERWYLTGDKAYRDKEGYFWFIGRSDDVINSSGYRIGPFEVESVLKQHPAVVESAVVSSPDSARGEVVKAFVVLTSDYKNANHESLVKDLQSFCKSNAAPYKYPRKIQFVTSDFLPKTVSGKIQRNILRKLEWQTQNAKL